MQPLAADMNKPYPAFMSPLMEDAAKRLQYVKWFFSDGSKRALRGIKKERRRSHCCLRRTGIRCKQTVSPRQSVSYHSSSCLH